MALQDEVSCSEPPCPAPSPQPVPGGRTAAQGWCAGPWAGRKDRTRGAGAGVPACRGALRVLQRHGFPGRLRPRKEEVLSPEEGPGAKREPAVRGSCPESSAEGSAAGGPGLLWRVSRRPRPRPPRRLAWKTAATPGSDQGPALGPTPRRLRAVGEERKGLAQAACGGAGAGGADLMGLRPRPGLEA